MGGIQRLFKYALLQLGNPKLTWSWIWQQMWRATRRASISTLVARKTRENVGPLTTAARPLMTQNMEKAEVLNAFFMLVFTGKTSLQESKVLENSREVWRKENLHFVRDDQIREYLS